MDIILDIIHIVGIASFSAAGAMVAIDKETDFFGVIFLSVITCFGGGMIRDIIAGQAIGRDLPVFFTDMNLEIIVSILTASAVFLIAAMFKKLYVKEEATVEKINNILDALGIGVFAAAGTAAYLPLGPLVAILMGLISSIGGSITRDVILRDIPFILRKRIYALACLSGSAVYYIVAVFIMKGLPSADIVATICCVIVTFSIRLCATIFKWNMPKAIIFSEMKEECSEERAEEATHADV